tara:strand:+ start:3159 stop:3557 length:399 start_codon:yes stop_codon:yes gene_type:complete
MLRHITKETLPIVQEWFYERWGKGLANLPEIGLMATEDTDSNTDYKDKAAGFIYHDPTCNVGWIGWVVTNPENSLADTQYIDYLFRGLEMIAKKHGIKTLLYTTEKDSMGKLLENRGYQLGDTGVTHYIKQI